MDSKLSVHTIFKSCCSCWLLRFTNPRNSCYYYRSNQKIPNALSQSAKATKDGKIVHNDRCTISDPSGDHYLVMLHTKESCTCPTKRMSSQPRWACSKTVNLREPTSHISRKEKTVKDPEKTTPDVKMKPGTNANKDFIPIQYYQYSKFTKRMLPNT